MTRHEQEPGARITRRQLFEKTIEAAKISALVPILAACASDKATKTDPEKRFAFEEITPTSTKSEVRTLLDNLAPSPYRDFVMRFAYPLLQENPPKYISLGGENIEVADARVKDRESTGTDLRGVFSIRAPQQTRFVNLQDNYELKVPFPHIKQEKDGEPPLGRAIVTDKNIPFPIGIEPQIGWVYPKRATIPQRQIDNYLKNRQFALIKEAFSLAWGIAYIEEVINSMQRYGIYAYLEENGQRVEIASQSYITILDTKGRLYALSDAAPFDLAVKAIQSDKNLFEYLRSLKEKTKFVDAIAARDFGLTPTEMIRQTIDFTLQNKDIARQAVGNRCDFEKLP